MLVTKPQEYLNLPTPSNNMIIVQSLSKIYSGNCQIYEVYLLYDLLWVGSTPVFMWLVVICYISAFFFFR